MRTQAEERRKKGGTPPYSKKMGSVPNCLGKKHPKITKTVKGLH
jgi:hypothetical protein